jgi:hypothetical protein
MDNKINQSIRPSPESALSNRITNCSVSGLPHQLRLRQISGISAWAESHPRTTPLLSDEAISRESIYSNRG